MVITANGDALTAGAEDFIKRLHKHDVGDDQCTSSLLKHIKAPLPLVWSLVRRFDQPQSYKPFVSRCIMQGDLKIGTVREVNVKSGLPATTSRERLELLDDEEHIFSMRIVGGDHRLKPMVWIWMYARKVYTFIAESSVLSIKKLFVHLQFE